MPLMFRDNGWCGLSGSLAAAIFLLAVEPAIAASPARTEVIEVSAPRGFSMDNGLATLNGPTVKQGTTLLRAASATATGLDEDNGKNSSWKFSGDVHLEFDGAVLDAEAANAVFANGKLSSVVVQSGAQRKKPVRVEFNGAVLAVDGATVTFVNGRINTIQAQGAPAQFSHLLGATRAHGRANRLDYDAGTRRIRLSVDTWFSRGNKEVETQEVTYNLADGTYSSPVAATVIMRPDESVPAPRTPDRATAK